METPSTSGPSFVGVNVSCGVSGDGWVGVGLFSYDTPN